MHSSMLAILTAATTDHHVRLPGLEQMVGRYRVPRKKTYSTRIKGLVFNSMASVPGTLMYLFPERWIRCIHS